MSILVTGSAGHLGEALMRELRQSGAHPVGLDIKASPYTTMIGSIIDPAITTKAMQGIKCVYHTATLHKPHMVTHSAGDFINTNILGTLNLLEAATKANVDAFVFTSTTSVFGDALRPPPGEPAAWINESVQPAVKNIYGATKLAAEDLCRLAHHNQGLNCIVLRTSRFFPEDDDDKEKQKRYSADNLKANEFLYRRVDLEDAVSAHFLAAQYAPNLGHELFVISATTPFDKTHLSALGKDAPPVVTALYPDLADIYASRNLHLLPVLDRVYSNHRARELLNWQPQWDFAKALDCLSRGEPVASQLAQNVGVKGYHSSIFTDGPYPVETSADNR